MGCVAEIPLSALPSQNFQKRRYPAYHPHTSARLTKKALELLYSRHVNVPGIILNLVDTSLPEYYYTSIRNTVAVSEPELLLGDN